MPRNTRNERPSGNNRRKPSRGDASDSRSQRSSGGNFRRKPEGDSERPRFRSERPTNRKEGGSFRSRSERPEGSEGKRFNRGNRDQRSDFPGERSSAGPRKSFGEGRGEERKPRFESKPRGRSGGFRKTDGDSSEKRFGKRSDERSSSRPFGGNRSVRPKPFRSKEGGEGEEPSREKRTYSGKFERKSFVKNRLDKQRGTGSRKREAKPASDSDLIRLNKFISNSGVCSRREADELIKMGLVSVNGVTITEMGYKVKKTDEVRYEGKRLKAEKPVYILVNKPKGYITTTDDPQERHTVMDLIANACSERVYPVGRLDRNTTGLLLLTNDGDLADKLTHPSYNVKKIYKVELDRPITKADFERVKEGVVLEEGRAVPDDVAIVSDDNKTVGIELHIGWNRIVRRIFESLEYEVVKLDRVVYAGLDKKALGRGEWRFLKEEEVIRLKHLK